MLVLGVESDVDDLAPFEPMLQAARRRDLPLLCANPDLVVLHGGVLELCAGSVAQRYEEIGGRVRYHGKPHGNVYRRALKALGVDRSRILAIGDAVRTDLAAAQGMGVDALFIASGIHHQDVLAGGEIDPDRLAAFFAAPGTPSALAAMTQLNHMGGDLREDGADRLVVRGVPRLTGAALSSFNDHRVLMSLALAGSVADGQTRLSYPNAYRISYPDFLRDMTGIGMRVFPRDGGFRAPAASLPELLRRWAVDRPDDTAVVDVRPEGTRRTTWRELDAGVDRAAAALLALGVQPGEPE